VEFVHLVGFITKKFVTRYSTGLPFSGILSDQMNSIPLIEY